MKANWLDKIIIFIFPRWGLKRSAIRANLEKFSRPGGVSQQQPQSNRDNWLTLSRHKKEDQDPDDKILNRRKPTTMKNFEVALGLSCKENKKWIR